MPYPVAAARGKNVVLDGAGSTPWYLAGGLSASDWLATFQPIGAASLAASYSNLINPGTNDAAPGTAPTFNAATGWAFASASLQYLEIGSGAIKAAPPLSFIALCKFPNFDDYMNILGVFRDNTDRDLIAMGGRKTDANLKMWTSDTSGSSAAATTAVDSLSANTWLVCAGVTASTASRAAYINGGSKETDTNDKVAANMNKTFIGVFHDSSSFSQYMNGNIGACGIADKALSDAEVLAVSNAMLALVA